MKKSKLSIILAGALIITGCAGAGNQQVKETIREAGKIAKESSDYYEIFTAIDDSTLPLPDLSIYSSYSNDDIEENSPYYEEFKEFNVPMAMTGRVNAYIKYYTERVPSTTQSWLNRSNKYMYLVKDIFLQEGLPSDLVVLAFTESGYNTHAVSHAGATGMWQFMQGTGKMYGMEQNFWVDERRDFEKATRAAAKYLKSLYERFGDWYLALAAYNAGPGRMARAIQKHDTNDFFKISSRNTLKLETRDYVPKYLAQLIIYKNYLKYGFTPPTDMPLLFSTVEAPASTNIYWLADELGVSYDLMRDLNPALKLPITPPLVYKIRVPYLRDSEAKQILAQAGAEERARYKIYEGRRGESVAEIAKKFDVSKDDILRVNGIKRESLLTARKVFIPIKEYSNIKIDSMFAQVLEKIDPKYYKVKKGDTFIGIAHNHNMRMKDLQKLNPNIRPSRIYPGQYIMVTKDGYTNVSIAAKKSSRQVANIKYRVKSGDSLWSIAKKFNTSVASIKNINKLTSSNIYAGRVLTIKKNGR